MQLGLARWNISIRPDNAEEGTWSWSKQKTDPILDSEWPLDVIDWRIIERSRSIL